jgi:hypothetical protein
MDGQVVKSALRLFLEERVGEALVLVEGPDPVLGLLRADDPVAVKRTIRSRSNGWSTVAATSRSPSRPLRIKASRAADSMTSRSCS